jgi:MutS domain V
LLHPFDAICTRMTLPADFNATSSSFMLEARDTASMLQAVSPNALALVDELGKATSSTDGSAFAWAVAEELLAARALTLFATHFVLDRLATIYPVVTVWHMGVTDDDKQYKQTHERLAGPCTESHYGISMASKVGLLVSYRFACKVCTSGVTCTWAHTCKARLCAGATSNVRGRSGTSTICQAECARGVPHGDSRERGQRARAPAVDASDDGVHVPRPCIPSCQPRTTRTGSIHEMRRNTRVSERKIWCIRTDR